MPWYNGDYPPGYKNQPKQLRNKAVEIANEVLKDGAKIRRGHSHGPKRTRQYFKNQQAPEEDKQTGS